MGKTVEVSARDEQVVIACDGREIERHPLMAPAAISIKDKQYQGATRRPLRAIRVRTATECAFIALGPVAEEFLRTAAAAGTSRLAGELAEILSLEARWGREQLVAALEGATGFRGFKAGGDRGL